MRTRLIVVSGFGSLSLHATRWRRSLLTGVVVLLLAACSSGPKRPVFYPNAHIRAVGQAQAELEADQCMELADSYSVSRTRDGEVGRRTTEGAIIGGAAAGAWGLVRGDAGNRAAAGAAAGAATGATRGVFKSSELSPTFKRFVQRCLSERGYDVIGWE